MKRSTKKLFVYLPAAIASLLAFSLGIYSAWSSPMLPKLNGSVDPERNPLGRPATLLEQSLMAAMLPFAALFGSPLAGLLMDKFGRKKTLTFIAFPMILSWLILAFSTNIILFYIGRFIAGVCTGYTLAILPMYLAEIAEDHNRGIIGCLIGNFIPLGMLFCFAIGPFVSIQVFSLLSIIPLLIFIPAFSLCAPESPYFLALRNNENNLKTCLMKLRKHKNAEEIENEISTTKKMVQEMWQDKKGLKDIFKIKVLRKGLVITLGLITFQQFSGIGVVVPYMETIFEASNSALTPEISSIITGIVQLCATGIALSLVDTSGRKILFLISTIGSGTAIITLGLYFYLQDHHYDVNRISWLPVTSLIAYIIFFNLGLGPLPWTVMGELFAPNVKAAASAICTLTFFVQNFLIMLCFPFLSVALGMAITFWVYGAICLMGILFIYCVVPETKGKSLQEIQDVLGKN